MWKCASFSPYTRRPLVIYDFAPDPIWISSYRRKLCFLFYQCTCPVRLLNVWTVEKIWSGSQVTCDREQLAGLAPRAGGQPAISWSSLWLIYQPSSPQVDQPDYSIIYTGHQLRFREKETQVKVLLLPHGWNIRKDDQVFCCSWNWSDRQLPAS